MTNRRFVIRAFGLDSAIGLRHSGLLSASGCESLPPWLRLAHGYSVFSSATTLRFPKQAVAVMLRRKVMPLTDYGLGLTISPVRHRTISALAMGVLMGTLCAPPAHAGWIETREDGSGDARFTLETALLFTRTIMKKATTDLNSMET